MGSLLRDPAHADVTLRAGGRLFPAHRAVLGARCAVLGCMFRSGMRESEPDSEVCIHDRVCGVPA